MTSFPPVPAEVKGIAHFLKVAEEHDQRNVVVSYWCRMYACHVAMKIVPGKKSPEVSNLLVTIMDWLEETKKAHSDLDGITNQTCAEALIEEYAIQLFAFADAQDHEENFGKNMIKAFYTAGILFDVLQQFGDLSEEIFNKRKYAKWKAAYIHNCLKLGEKPMPGPPNTGNDSLMAKADLENDENSADRASPNPFQPISPANPPPTQPSFPTDWSNFPSVPTSQFPNVQPANVISPINPPAPVVKPIPVTPTPVTPAPTTSGSDTVHLDAEQIEKAQKYCKWAGSALTYDDVKTAIDNLQKALHLLQFGKEQ